MAAPTSITATVDRDEYCRFESERDTIIVTVDVQGTSLSGEEITVELRKARFNRDVIVATKTITLALNTPHAASINFYLPELVDSKLAPKARRGKYFINTFSNTAPGTTSETSDFRLTMVSTARLKADYLHGTDQFSSDQLGVVDQPKIITGITVEEVSRGHKQAAFPLSYNQIIDTPPVVTGTNTETFVLTNGMTLVIQLNGDDTQTATFLSADFGNIAAATALEVAAVINTDMSGVIASDVGGAVVITGDSGTNSIFVDPSGSSTTVLGLTGLSSTSNIVRTLSWCDGPVVTIDSSSNTYTLVKGARTSGSDYIKVRLASVALLPTQSRAENIVISRKPLDDERMQQIIDQAISWVEDVELAVFLEPTRVVTEVDPDILSYPTGTDLPTIVAADFDKVVNALFYSVPAPGHWISFKCPYYPIICFEELYGKLSNTRIVDIALEWIELHDKTGWVELVPFNQEVAFNFIGLVWVESLRGPIDLPNFWNFTALVGFRETPQILIELVAKKAAMDILTIAGQAFRGGFSSQSVSREGVTESVSYTASATFGVYSASIEDYRKWIDATLVKLKGAFRGPNMVVV